MTGETLFDGARMCRRLPTGSRVAAAIARMQLAEETEAESDAEVWAGDSDTEEPPPHRTQAAVQAPSATTAFIPPQHSPQAYRGRSPCDLPLRLSKSMTCVRLAARMDMVLMKRQRLKMNCTMMGVRAAWVQEPRSSQRPRKRACRRAETTHMATTRPAAGQACDSGVAVARHAGSQRDEIRPSKRVKYMLDRRVRSALDQAAQTASPPATPLGSVRRGGSSSE